MLCLGDIRNSAVARISGVSANGDDFIQLVNEATRRLLKRGDWDGTIVPMFTCISYGSCVVWPRYVGQIRQLNTCNKQHVPIKNVWWDFLPYDRSLAWNSNEWWGWRGGAASMVNQGRSAVFQDIMGEGRTIRAYPESSLDTGKTITIFGEDNNGQRLMTRGVGPWKDGITLSLKAPYVETPSYVRRIDRVLKDLTTGPVRLYAWNSTNSVLEDVAYYEPSETNPSYIRSNLNLGCAGGRGCDGTASNNKGVVALVKLQYVPVLVDTDLVLIDNIQALKFMIQSIRCEEAQDLTNARAFLVNAVDELNQDLKDANPDTQIPVDFGSMGHDQHYLGRQTCF